MNNQDWMEEIPPKVNLAKMRKKRPPPRWDEKIFAHTTINGKGRIARIYKATATPPHRYKGLRKRKARQKIRRNHKRL